MGITQNHLDLLLFIHNSERPNQITLSKNFRIGRFLTTEDVINLIQDLEQANMIETVRPVKYRESPYYVLTESGKRAIKKELIAGYKLPALKAFEQYGIGQEAVWTTIANMANIPLEFQDTIKNVLYTFLMLYYPSLVALLHGIFCRKT